MKKQALFTVVVLVTMLALAALGVSSARADEATTTDAIAGTWYGNMHFSNRNSVERIALLPFLPKEVHGAPIVALAIFYGGDIGEGEKLIAPQRRFGKAHGEHIGAQPYVQWQQAFDPLLTPGARNYWKSHNFRELRDEALDTMIAFAGKLPSPQCEIFVAHIAGAANRVPADAMAYGHRDARFVLNVHGRWDDATQDAMCIGWARAFFEAAAPHASGGAYVNFMTEDESSRVAAAYGANYARLAEIKKRHDPENVFHLNQNTKP